MGISWARVWAAFLCVFVAIDRAVPCTKNVSDAACVCRMVATWVLTWPLMVVLGGFVPDRQPFLRASLLFLVQAFFCYTSIRYLLERLVVESSELGHRCGFLSNSLLASLILTFYIFVSLSLPIREFKPFNISLQIMGALFLTRICIATIPPCLSLLSLFVCMRSTWLFFYHSRIRYLGILGTVSGKGITHRELVDFVCYMKYDKCREFTGIRALYSLCQEVVSYVYGHARGFEAILAAMHSNDECMQQAAALMVGFFVHLETVEKKVSSQRRLRSQEALARRLVDLSLRSTVEGPRKEAAMWSLRKWAQHDLRTFVGAQVRASSSFSQDLTQRIEMLKDLGGHKCEDLGGHECKIKEYECGLLRLFNILHALLQDPSSRARFTDDKDIARLPDKLRVVVAPKSSSAALSTFQRHLQEAANAALAILHGNMQPDASMAISTPPCIPGDWEDEPVLDLQTVLSCCTLAGMLVGEFYLFQYLRPLVSDLSK